MAKEQQSKSTSSKEQDDRYFQLIRQSLAVCRSYHPKFGKTGKAGLTLEEFRTLYHAYANSYLPVLLLLSTQIDDDIAARYLRAQWLILRGALSGTPLQSTYSFARDVLGYDLAGFFARNATRIQTEVETVIEALLS